MAKKWMQTAAGRKAQSKRMKAVWAARNQHREEITVSDVIDAPVYHRPVRITLIDHSDAQVADVLRALAALKNSTIEINIIS